jgi:hypothetical protein
MDNPDKPASYGTQETTQKEDTQSKTTTQYAHTYTNNASSPTNNWRVGNQTILGVAPIYNVKTKQDFIVCAFVDRS